MANERLRSALHTAGMTSSDLGERVHVDAKTVDRWITADRVPHRSNRQRVASLLGQREAFLWPDAESALRADSASASEVIAVYPNRGSIPASHWHDLFESAVESIDILAFAASFLHDTLADLNDLLATQASQGVRIRLAFGDPDCEAVRVRGAEEGIGELLAERCRLTWKYLEALDCEKEIEKRSHGNTLYCSMFRFDDQMLVNHHLFGAPANQSPRHAPPATEGRTALRPASTFPRARLGVRQS